MNKVMVTKNVEIDEHHNFLGRAAKEGEIFYRYFGCTYGCIDTNGGIALSEVQGETPFFEFPENAIKYFEKVL